MNVEPNDAYLRHKMYDCIKPLLGLANIRILIVFKIFAVESDYISPLCVDFKDTSELCDAFIKYMS